MLTDVPSGCNRYLTSVALAFVLSFLAVIDDAQSANLLLDPSFENSDLSAYMSSVWTGSGTIGLAVEVSRTGLQCLKITGSNGSATVWQVLSVSPNTNYTASLWVRTQGLSGAGKTGLEIKTNSSYYYLSPDTQPNDSQWHQISVDFNSGSATGDIHLCL